MLAKPLSITSGPWGKSLHANWSSNALVHRSQIAKPAVLEAVPWAESKQRQKEGMYVYLLRRTSRIFKLQ